MEQLIFFLLGVVVGQMIAVRVMVGLLRETQQHAGRCPYSSWDTLPGHAPEFYPEREADPTRSHDREC